MPRRWGISILYVLILIGIIWLADTGSLNVRALARQIPYFDKLGHFILIGLLAFFVNISWHCARFRLRQLSPMKGGTIVFILVTLEECSQYFIPSRTFDWTDLAADVLGIVVFGQLALFLCRKRTAG